MRLTGFMLVALFIAADAVSQTPGEAITFNRHIAPLVYRYCSSCHRPGEAAPFPLLTYDDVRKRGKQIVLVTKSRYMPPWLPEPGYGEFVGERRLTDAQLQLFVRW